MEFPITQAQVGTRPQVQLPSHNILKTLGEEGMRKMVSDHYDLLRESKIKGLFPPSDEGFAMAKKHSADFFIQICGGPRYFDESRGAPMMAARHSPFKITQEARKVWLESYIQVIKELPMNDELKLSLWNYLDIFSIWMLNSHDD